MEETEVLTQTEGKDGISLKTEDETKTPEVQKEVVIPVKFNKQIRNLNAEEAATLAQKGLKYEMIQSDFEKLRDLAAKQKMSVSDYINTLESRRRSERKADILNECGGNEKLAEHLLTLEEGEEKDAGLEELKKYFPAVKNLDDLPAAVVESARLKGDNILNEYLKYRLLKQRQAAEEQNAGRDAENSSIGSLKNPSKNDAENDFIKALWGR